MIEEAQRNNWSMAASASEEFHTLVNNHVYSMLGVVTIDYLGHKVKLVKMRNPHGREQYTGPWWDEDPRWTDALRK